MARFYPRADALSILRVPLLANKSGETKKSKTYLDFMRQINILKSIQETGITKQYEINLD